MEPTDKKIDNAPQGASRDRSRTPPGSLRVEAPPGCLQRPPECPSQFYIEIPYGGTETKRVVLKLHFVPADKQS